MHSNWNKSNQNIANPLIRLNATKNNDHNNEKDVNSETKTMMFQCNNSGNFESNDFIFQLKLTQNPVEATESSLNSRF